MCCPSSPVLLLTAGFISAKQVARTREAAGFFPKQALLMLKNGNVLPPHLDSACRWWHHRQERFCTCRSHSRAQALDLPNTTWKTCSTLEPPWTHPRRCLHRNPPTLFFFFSACKSPLKKSVGMSCPPPIQGIWLQMGIAARFLFFKVQTRQKPKQKSPTGTILLVHTGMRRAV